MNPNTKQAQMLQEVWRRAYRLGRFALTLQTPEQVTSIRFALYKATKAVMDGRVIDSELKVARENCSLRIEGLVITAYRNDIDPMLELLGEQLGIGQEEVTPQAQTKEQAALAESIASVRRLLGEGKEAGPEGEGSKAAGKATPYYTRD